MNKEQIRKPEIDPKKTGVPSEFISCFQPSKRVLLKVKKCDICKSFMASNSLEYLNFEFSTLMVLVSNKNNDKRVSNVWILSSWHKNEGTQTNCTEIEYKGEEHFSCCKIVEKFVFNSANPRKRRRKQTFFAVEKPRTFQIMKILKRGKGELGCNFFNFLTIKDFFCLSSLNQIIKIYPKSWSTHQHGAWIHVIWMCSWWTRWFVLTKQNPPNSSN